LPAIVEGSTNNIEKIGVLTADYSIVLRNPSIPSKSTIVYISLEFNLAVSLNLL